MQTTPLWEGEVILYGRIAIVTPRIVLSWSGIPITLVEIDGAVEKGAHVFVAGSATKAPDGWRIERARITCDRAAAARADPLA